MRCHFYPRSPCGERPIAGRITSNGTKISIHALLAESDLVVTAFPGSADRFLSTLSLRRATGNNSNMLFSVVISIHALLAESDTVLPLIVLKHIIFLSTLSLRRATHCHLIPNSGTFHFYPRSPCGERPVCSS